MTVMNNRVQQEQEFWNSYAEKYDTFISKKASGYYDVLLAKLTADIQGTEHLLEVATGTGVLGLSLCEQIPQVTATDLSVEMIKVAQQKAERQKINHIDFRVEDSCNLTFPENTFDTILAANVLHLLFEPQQAMREMKRVLKKGGKIIIPTYCHGQSWRSQLASRLMSILTHRGFKARSRWSISGFSNFVIDAGFHVDKTVIIKGLIPMAYLVATELSLSENNNQAK